MYMTTGVVVMFGTFQYKFGECIDVVGNPQDVTSPYKLFWLRVLFGRGRSRWFGSWAENPLPVAMREPLYKTYAWMYGANLDEVRYPLDSYRCIQDFFSRKLKDNVRPIADTLMVSPCDSTIMCMGEITEQNERIPMIKHATYNVASFLGQCPVSVDKLPEDAIATKRKSGDDENDKRRIKYAVLYLAPGDYHRVHAPCRIKVHEGDHYSGEALPLFKGLLTRLNDVFTVNERVVLTGSWEHGRMWVGLVGAYNVNSIKLAFEKDLKTNNYRSVPAYRGGEVGSRRWPDVELDKGDELGGFKMGSTVVLVFDAPDDFRWDVEVGDKLKMGQALGH